MRLDDREPNWLLSRTSERSLSRYYADRYDSDLHPVHYAIRHPLLTVGALAAVARLPVYDARLSTEHAAGVIYDAVARSLAWGIPVGTTGMSVLAIPEDFSTYDFGPTKKTLRRKSRRARRRGVTSRLVSEPGERRKLLDLAWVAETGHPDSRYRRESPNFSDLEDLDPWLAAFDAAGRPLLLAVTPTDGEWALLHYFRTLGRGPEFSDSRYLMSGDLVRALSDRGVRYLVDARHPLGLPNGLRYFQRLVGFRIARITASRTTPG